MSNDSILEMNETNVSSRDEEALDDDEEARLQAELEIVTKMRQAFTAALQMLEAARDDLIEMGWRMERLQQASVQCRTAWQEQSTKPKNDKRHDFVGAP